MNLTGENALAYLVLVTKTKKEVFQVFHLLQVIQDRPGAEGRQGPVGVGVVGVEGGSQQDGGRNVGPGLPVWLVMVVVLD